MSGILQILGAAWGLGRVTWTVVGLVDRNTSPQRLTVQASDSVFGDPWFGVRKTLVVVYRYDDGPAGVATAREGDTLTISGPPLAQVKPAVTLIPQLTIWGAAYGPENVTGITQLYVDRLSQALNITANNDTFGDSWSGNRKSFVIVASYTNQVPFIDIVPEGSVYSLKYRPPLQILSAFWGLKSVRAIAQASVSRRALSVNASDTVFGDGWPGVVKSLDVVYQYGDFLPQQAIAIEGNTLSIDFDPSVPAYRPPADPRTLNIFSAAYGPADVTSKVVALTAAGRRNFTADNAQFGETWPGHRKSFSMTYSWGPAAVSSKCVAEGSAVEIVEPTFDGMKSFLSMAGLFASGDILKIQTGAGAFWTVEADGRISASGTSSDTAAQFKIGVAGAGAPEITLQNVANGTYVTVGSDGTLRTKGTASTAARIVPSLLSNGTAAFSLAGGTGPTFVSVNASNAILANGNYTSDFSTAFNMVLHPTAEGAENHARAYGALAPELPGDAPSLLFLKCVWDLTGGLFLALGFGPLINGQAARPGIWQLLLSSARVKARVDEIIEFAKENPGKTIAGVLLSLLVVLYEERLLWPLFRFLLRNQAPWLLVSFALAKILQLTVIPEVVIAERTVALGFWVYTTASDIFTYLESIGSIGQLAAVEAGKHDPTTTVAG
jgi:hypothetical protein